MQTGLVFLVYGFAIGFIALALLGHFLLLGDLWQALRQRNFSRDLARSSAELARRDADVHEAMKVPAE
jgi:hypothetical protein